MGDHWQEAKLLQVAQWLQNYVHERKYPRDFNINFN